MTLLADALRPQTKFDNTPASSLLAMLRYMRPAGSASEESFIRTFLEPLGVTRDERGNLIKRIGTAPILWSSHTDTVHHKSGVQRLLVSGDIVSAVGSNCLGGDCTAGVWLMVEMIKAGVEGLYIFHREEEIGGHGSNFIADKTPEVVAGIEFAIALDRKGKTSVITHQGYRTASDVFARSLATILGGGYGPDQGGIFTDTANYVELIGECTNLSVGYEKAHTPRETMDLAFVLALRETLLKADFTGLVSERKAGSYEQNPLWDDFLPANDKGGKRKKGKAGKVRRGDDLNDFTAPWNDYSSDDFDWTNDYGHQSGRGYQSTLHVADALERFVRDNPAGVADFLHQCGYSLDELGEYCGVNAGGYSYR